jgi:hypothetical protein
MGMYSANPIGANGSGAIGDANCSNTFWQSMGFGKHAHAASTDSAKRASRAEFARVFRARPRYRRRVRVRESPSATGDGLAS